MAKKKKKKKTVAMSMAIQDKAAIAEGCYFDEQAADFVCEFFETYLRHTMGTHAGKPFKLLDWQRDDVLRPLFGWKCEDGSNRFNRGFIWTGKKQGKSTLSAGIALFYLMTSGKRAEVYGVATTREQASIIYREAAAMARTCKMLSTKLKAFDSKKRIFYGSNNSFYQALAGEMMARGTEGVNPNLVLFDELHAMRSRSLYEGLAYASAARPDSLLLSVSTVGIADQSLIWWEQYDYTKKLLEGAIIDPHCFGYLKQADEACVDDFEKCGDEKQWFKAMPSLGHTVQVETIRQHYTEAKNSPAKQNAFRRYLLNIPTQQIDRVVPMSEWYSCQSDVPDLMGRHCYAGLDLAAHEDLSCFCLYFPPIETETKTEPAYVLSSFFCPADKINERKASGMAFYSQWVDEGWLTISGGARIDANPIQDVIREASEFYQIDQIGFDPWGADAVVNDLIDEGIPLVAVGQSMRGMTTGVRTLLDDIAEAKIHHDGNPVMSWCLANCASDEKSDGGIRFSKKKSADKIDGAVALAMARGRAVDNANKSNKQPEIFF
jgi:phage terminase large subunit-like protein